MRVTESSQSRAEACQRDNQNNLISINVETKVNNSSLYKSHLSVRLTFKLN